MPTSTFNNLTKMKRTRIFESGFAEFSQKNYYEASINTIVSGAGIPKGSFYQYFNDKDDFYWYIINRVLDEQIIKYDKLLEVSNGNFIKAEEHLFFHFTILLENYKYRNLIRNVFDSSYFDVTNSLISSGGVDYDMIYGLINHKKAKIIKKMSKEEFIIVFGMMRNILNNSIITLISKDLSTKDAIAFYQTQVNFLLKGIL